MHFMLEDFPRSLQEVFCPKWYKFWICIFFYFSEDSSKTLRNSRKNLGRLLEKSSNVFYARRFPTKSLGSLPKSSSQSGTKE
ncbi:hypothetical protein Bca101_090977 [Brassica carinata]